MNKKEWWVNSEPEGTICSIQMLPLINGNRMLKCWYSWRLSFHYS